MVESSSGKQVAKQPKKEATCAEKRKNIGENCYGERG